MNNKIILRLYILFCEILWCISFPINLVLYYLFKVQYSCVFAEYIDDYLYEKYKGMY